MGLINFMFNSDSRKSLRKIDKIASAVEALESKYAPMTDAELRAQTDVLKGRLANGETLDDILTDAFAVVPVPLPHAGAGPCRAGPKRGAEVRLPDV